MKRVIIMLAVILAGSGLCSTFLSTATHAEEPIAVAKPKSGGCDASLFGMPAWYNGLSGGDGCEFTPIKNGEEVDVVKTSAKIGANLLQAALMLAAYVAVFFLIRGGFEYMTNSSSPDGMAKARKTIMNALIGMAIAILAASIVNAIGAAIR